jgi:Flp pilus assembly protein TadD
VRTVRYTLRAMGDGPQQNTSRDAPGRRRTDRASGTSWRWAWGLLPVGLAALVYINALHNPFVYDDHRLILENPSLLQPRNFWGLILHERTRPVVNISYAVDRALWGPQPFGFHLTNLILHAVNVALFFTVGCVVIEDRRQAPRSWLSRLRRPELAAATAATLFAVHPMMTEAVGYISGRSELLAALFVLLGMLAARQFMVTDRRRWLPAVFVCWALALLSRETPAMFPFIVLFYDLVVRTDSARARRRHWEWLHLPMISLSTAAVATRLYLFATVEHPEGLHPHWLFGLVEVDVIGRYLSLLLVPAGQAIFHEVRSVPSVFDAGALTALAALAAFIGLLFVTKRVLPTVSFGLFWFLAVLIPSSVLVVLDRGEPMAEHRVYLASCGLFLATGLGAAWIGEHVARGRQLLVHWTMVLVAVMVIASLAGRTLIRNIVWSNPVDLWQEAADGAPDHWLPAVGLGEALHEQGRHAEAVVELRRAKTLNPAEPAIYAKLGTCLLETAQVDAARLVFSELAIINPRAPEASNGLGAVAMVRGEPDLARREFERTLSVDPGNIAARRGLVGLDEAAGDRPEVLRLCEEIRVLAGTAEEEGCGGTSQVRASGGGLMAH